LHRATLGAASPHGELRLFFTPRHQEDHTVEKPKMLSWRPTAEDARRLAALRRTTGGGWTKAIRRALEIAAPKTEAAPDRKQAA
jgi:hypothetical protein